MTLGTPRGTSDLDSAFETLAQAAPKSLLVLPHPMFLSERSRIAALAMEKRVPSVYGHREHVEVGGLMSYGVDLRDTHYRAASHAAKILSGGHPGDIPGEFPTKLELVINMRTAKALGVAVPQALLGRADELVE